MKRNVLNLLLGAILLVAFSACNKNLAELSADYIKVNPAVLENVGGKVNAEITMTIPAKYFDKKSILTVTPVLVTSDGKEFEAAPASYQGEKVLNNYQVISYENGGVVSQQMSLDFDESMRQSELYLEFSVKRGKKTYQLPRLKVADGVISTVSLLDAAALTPALGEDKFQRVIEDRQEASILFLIQQSNIRNSELKTKEIQSLVQRLSEANWEENQKISRVDIFGYASPDGPQALNARLAEEREKNSMNFINRELKKLKETPDINAKNTAEDWAGFQALMEKSDIQDKEVILRVLSMYSDPEQREREMRNIAKTYTQVAEEILPQLRRSRLNVTVELIGKSDEEILSLLKSDPQVLSLEEILYGAEGYRRTRYDSYTTVNPSNSYFLRPQQVTCIEKYAGDAEKIVGRTYYTYQSITGSVSRRKPDRRRPVLERRRFSAHCGTMRRLRTRPRVRRQQLLFFLPHALGQVVHGQLQFCHAHACGPISPSQGQPP